MAGFPTSTAYSKAWGPAVPGAPSRKLHLPSRAAAPVPSPAPAPVAPGKKRKHRNIACVTCNKQKKRCGEVRPCGRCLELGIICQQPVKPEGYSYFSKKRKPSTPAIPPSPPLFNDGRNQFVSPPTVAAENDYQRHNLPSPSPSVSTVGTPQPSSTSVSPYDDPASTISASAGKSGDASELDRLDSNLRPPSVSPDRAFLPTPTSETLKPPQVWDISRWDLPALPAPQEEVPDDVVKNSKYVGAPFFGLEKPIHEFDFTISSEPMGLGDIGAGEVGVQGAEEAHGAAAGVAASGVASDAVKEITWDPDWLDEVDLSNTDLVLDDVDPSNLDFSCLGDDFLVDPQFFAQHILPSPPEQPPPLWSGAESIRLSPSRQEYTE